RQISLPTVWFALTIRWLLGVPNFCRRLRCIQVRRVEIILAGYTRQCEKGVTPRVSECSTHSFGARYVIDSANRPGRAHPFTTRMAQSRHELNDAGRLINGGCLKDGDFMLAQGLAQNLQSAR